MPYKNEEDRKAQSKRYYLENKEKIAEYKKEYIKRVGVNKEKANEACRKYYHANKEYHAAKHKKYVEENREHLRAANNEWRRNNPDKARAYKHARRTALKTPFPQVDWSNRLAKFNTYCPYCDSNGHVLTVDHVIPVSLGGTDDMWNLVPCCFSCNSSKQDRLLWEWKPGFNFLHLMEYF